MTRKIEETDNKVRKEMSHRRRSFVFFSFFSAFSGKKSPAREKSDWPMLLMVHDNSRLRGGVRMTKRVARRKDGLLQVKIKEVLRESVGVFSASPP